MYAPEGLAASTGSGYPSFSLPLFLPHSSFPLYSFPFETLIIPLLFFSMISHLALSPLNVTNPGLLSVISFVFAVQGDPYQRRGSWRLYSLMWTIMPILLFGLDIQDETTPINQLFMYCLNSAKRLWPGWIWSTFLWIRVCFSYKPAATLLDIPVCGISCIP